jgi:Tfp pilus assembly protein PilO
LAIVPAAKDSAGLLTMDAVARTYRYLDPGEVAAQAKSTKEAK